MSQMLQDPHFWVTVSFVMFVALAYKKGARLLCNALDGRAARIKAELDEARRLREEAEAVLASYLAKQKECAQEGEALIAQARREADALTRQAEEDLKAAMEIRTRLAMEKIAQEEKRAIAEVRSNVVDISVAAARMIVTEHLGKVSGDELVRLAVADMERKVH